MFWWIPTYKYQGLQKASYTKSSSSNFKEESHLLNNDEFFVIFMLVFFPILYELKPFWLQRRFKPLWRF